MSLKSVNDILGFLELEEKFREQPFQRLLNCWSDVVGTAIAAHTRPLSINRDVLRVATSSAAWAQNLTFERQRLLAKLNAVLPNPLLDIRFSTAEWHTVREIGKQQQLPLPRQHPSYLDQQISVDRSMKSTPQNANAAFGDWAKAIQARSHSLPLCPQCQTPTPVGELQRWQVCFLCAAKQFSNTL